jgi:hypothetical protein
MLVIIWLVRSGFPLWALTMRWYVDASDLIIFYSRCMVIDFDILIASQH